MDGSEASTRYAAPSAITTGCCSHRGARPKAALRPSKSSRARSRRDLNDLRRKRLSRASRSALKDAIFTGLQHAVFQRLFAIPRHSNERGRLRKDNPRVGSVRPASAALRLGTSGTGQSRSPGRSRTWSRIRSLATRPAATPAKAACRRAGLALELAGSARSTER